AGWGRRRAVPPGVRLAAIGPPLAPVDDDAAAVASALAAAGVALDSRTIVEEDEHALERALTPATALTVLLAGPGGSTGDVARRVLARATGRHLVLNDRMLAALEEQYRRRDRPLPRRDERLALLPQGLAHGEGREVEVTAALADGEVWVRLRARGATPEKAAAALAAAERRVADALGADCYGRDGESLEQVVGRHLVARGLTLAVAESCTGGLVGHRLTGVPGSSAFFERGVVVYSNRAK